MGSNDGSLLTFFKNYGVKVLGIDPAKNLAKIANMRGIPTETRLFNVKSAKTIVNTYGKADVICGCNVIAHIDDLHQVMEGVDILLKKDGVFITEFPYLLDLINKNEFDTIYHEHLSYFSIKSWLRLVTSYGFEIVDVQRLLIHGGTLRITHRRKSDKQNKVQKTLNYLLSLENDAGLYSLDMFSDFANQIDKIKQELMELLTSLKKKKKR